MAYLHLRNWTLVVFSFPIFVTTFLSISDNPTSVFLPWIVFWLWLFLFLRVYANTAIPSFQEHRFNVLTSCFFISLCVLFDPLEYIDVVFLATFVAFSLIEFVLLPQLKTHG